MISSIPTPIPTFTLPYRAAATTTGSPAPDLGSHLRDYGTALVQGPSAGDGGPPRACCIDDACSTAPSLRTPQLPSYYLPTYLTGTPIVGPHSFPAPFFLWPPPPFRFQRVRFGRGSIAWRLASSLFLAGDAGVGGERRTCVLQTIGDIARQEAAAPVLL
ncbi:hypothetical protein BT67DRAFT_260465 [Trichocladium antarcticum]|uniref:Uncharacterized protein n=1 Tax=Trichocladium antarcticum TaxID=1450529 RepID=A0AAN6ZFN8_9PEZI|nr:hypothetical protein BT67DRAFT_260465 [Trichocladium antarcticum]